MKLAAKYTDREFHTVNLERAKYETGLGDDRATKEFVAV
jgi:hypothetical protein